MLFIPCFRGPFVQLGHLQESRHQHLPLSACNMLASRRSDVTQQFCLLLTWPLSVSLSIDIRPLESLHYIHDINWGPEHTLSLSCRIVPPIFTWSWAFCCLVSLRRNEHCQATKLGIMLRSRPCNIIQRTVPGERGWSYRHHRRRQHFSEGSCHCRLRENLQVELVGENRDGAPR